MNAKMKLKTTQIQFLPTRLVIMENFDSVPYYWGYREKDNHVVGGNIN